MERFFFFKNKTQQEVMCVLSCQSALTESMELSSGHTTIRARSKQTAEAGFAPG